MTHSWPHRDAAPEAAGCHVPAVRQRDCNGAYAHEAESGGRLFVTDLRMGQEPADTFHFDLGTAAARAAQNHVPTLKSTRPDVATALPWLWRRMWGEPLPPPR